MGAGDVGDEPAGKEVAGDEARPSSTPRQARRSHTSSAASPSTSSVVTITVGARAVLQQKAMIAVATSSAALAQSLTDRQIAVSGTTMHVRCGGTRAAGTPLVILEAGALNTADTWKEVQPAVAAFSRVCAHDRPGLGESGAAPAGLDAPGYITLLVDTLRAADELPPYVLVGHSMGGLIAQLYVATRPQDLAGIVLVDSSHADQGRRLAGLPRPRRSAPAAPASPRPARPSRPAPEAVSLEAFASALDHAAPRIPVPLTVLTGDRFTLPDDEAWQREWRAMHRELAAQSSGARHVLVAESGHGIQQDAPAVVIDAVRQMLSRRPLPAIAAAQQQHAEQLARQFALAAYPEFQNGTVDVQFSSPFSSDSIQVRLFRPGGEMPWSDPFVSIWMRVRGAYLEAWTAEGPGVHSADNATIAELVHNGESLGLRGLGRELQKRGAQFGPQRRGEFMRKVDLKSLEPSLGKIVESRVGFDWDPRSSSFPTAEWSVVLKVERADGQRHCYGLGYDVFEGRLAGLVSLPPGKRPGAKPGAC